MSDTAGGPGWWQASDGKWYPPESAAPPAEESGGGRLRGLAGKAAGAAKARVDARSEAKAAEAAEVEPDDEPMGPLPSGALLQVKSREPGRNSDVVLYPDRIERTKERSRMSVSRAKQDAEVIPMKAVSSVQAKKLGLGYTMVTVYASGNNIDFRLRHAEASAFKDAITQLLLSPPSSATPAAAPVDVAEQLTKLAGLRDAGVLTEDEFAAQKAKLLG